MYDPPPQPPRPFAADYPPERFPDGVPHNRSGRLTHDIDGRKLHARWIAGRRTAGGVDEAVPAAELDALATAITGHPPKRASVAPDPKLWGWYAPDHASRQPAGRILTRGWLPEDAHIRVLKHEIGHGVQHRVRGQPYRYFAIPDEPPHDGLAGQFRRIYNDQNNPDRARIGIDVDLTKPLPTHVVSPETRGYSRGVGDELWAEGVRAYLSDPNYIKTVAPEAAAYIRAWVNSHPTLSKTIQFNSMGLPLGAPFAITPRNQTNAAE
jgi:hypothetical protein